MACLGLINAVQAEDRAWSGSDDAAWERGGSEIVTR